MDEWICVTVPNGMTRTLLLLLHVSIHKSHWFIGNKKLLQSKDILVSCSLSVGLDLSLSLSISAKCQCFHVVFPLFSIHFALHISTNRHLFCSFNSRNDMRTYVRMKGARERAQARFGCDENIFIVYIVKKWKQFNDGCFFSYFHWIFVCLNVSVSPLPLCMLFIWKALCCCCFFLLYHSCISDVNSNILSWVLDSLCYNRKYVNEKVIIDKRNISAVACFFFLLYDPPNNSVFISFEFIATNKFAALVHFSFGIFIYYYFVYDCTITWAHVRKEYHSISVCCDTSYHFALFYIGKH